MNKKMVGIFGEDYSEFRCLCGKYRGKKYSEIGCCDRCGGNVIERVGLALYLSEMHKEGIGLLYKTIFNDDEIEVFDNKGYVLREILANALEPIEFVVISEIYGLFADAVRDFDEIGKILNISENRVSQIETEVLRKLRHPSHAKKLKDYIHDKDADSHKCAPEADYTADSGKDLQSLYIKHKDKYDTFIQKNIARGHCTSTSELFSYLCFNLLLGPVNADVAENTVKEMMKNNILFQGDTDNIKIVLKQCGYRFTNRADWICENRRRFADTNGEIGIVSLVHGLRSMNPIDARDLLVNNVKGLGMKAASHFLRGLGFSNNELAILDVYILESLEEFGVVHHLPRDLKGNIKRPTNNQYLRYEKLMKDWNTTIVHIPLDILDILLWERGRGDI
ncbi:sigma factor-like helix-turn-helix DNA-binding protein [Chloroflexota bacterium]